MVSPVLDGIDRAILRELRNSARIPWRELGQRVGLGATATADRVRRLEQLGVIRHYTVVTDPSALGIGLRAIVDIRLAKDADVDQFEVLLADTEEVQSAYHVTGPFDYQVRMSCADVSKLDLLLRGWKRAGYADETNTRIVLNDVDLQRERRSE